MKRYLLLSTALLAALTACGRDSGDDGSAMTPMPPGLPGVYAGSFPCSNCESIAATLWLRDDDRFVLRQTYVGGASPADNAYSFGRWSWDEHAAELVLQGRGPERRLAPLDAERLEMRSASPIDHVLTRDPSAPSFTDRVQIDGESVVAENGATFTQCVSGLVLPIADAGAFKELRRQQRVLNPRHKVAVTEVEAHITTVSSGESSHEVLVIDKVIKLKPGKGC